VNNEYADYQTGNNHVSTFAHISNENLYILMGLDSDQERELDKLSEVCVQIESFERNCNATMCNCK